MPKEKRQTPISAKLKKKPPRKPKNSERRSREYLTDAEIEKLRKAARSLGRHGMRDDALIFIMFRHGLRVSEIIALCWDQIDFKKGLLHVKRLKNGLPSTHPVRGTELRLLRQLQREYKTLLMFLHLNAKHRLRTGLFTISFHALVSRQNFHLLFTLICYVTALDFT